MRKKKTHKTRQRDVGIELLRWQAPSFRQVYRGQLWLIGMFISIALVVAFAVWQGLYVLIIAACLVAFVYLLTHREAPEMHTYKLMSKALVGPKQAHYLSDLKEFYVLYSPETHINELHLIKKKGVQRDVCIQLDELDPSELIVYLEADVPHNSEREEKFSEQFIRLLKL